MSVGLRILPCVCVRLCEREDYKLEEKKNLAGLKYHSQ